MLCTREEGMHNTPIFFKYLLHITQNTNYCIIIFDSFSPFLKAGAVFSCFKSDGNSGILTDALKH